MSEYLKIMSTEQAEAPERIGDHILFFYKTPAYVRYVGARFAHENYDTLHVYELNQHDVFILIYPLPENITRLQYRIVVDGIWMADPFNPVIEVDKTGTAFSILNLEYKKEEIIINPQIRDNTVSFKLRQRSSRLIYIAGDFNNWDPYMHRLKETAPGIYQISLNLPRGTYHYYYVVDGLPYADPDNPQRKLDSYKRDVSFFNVK